MNLCSRLPQSWRRLHSRKNGLLLSIFSPVFKPTTLTAQDFCGNQYRQRLKRGNQKWSQQTQSLVAAFSEIYTERMFQLLLSAYSTVGIQDTALFLGMNEDDAARFLFSYAVVMQQGWAVDPASRMLIVKKQPVATEQKLDPSKLHRLTEYVLHFEQ
ncbi:COP9 signalosome complex subunit 8-like [Populus alba x Populus x berolinensis]|nr:COP9 signalosome complex subunit 8-like [Populus alba x Populus x berolinensis]